MAEDQVGLLAAAEDFAGQLNALVAEVLPGQQPSFLAEATADGMVTVAPARDDEDRERAPLWIVVKGSAREHQLLIRAEYVCQLGSQSALPVRRVLAGSAIPERSE